MIKIIFFILLIFLKLNQEQILFKNRFFPHFQKSFKDQVELKTTR